MIIDDTFEESRKNKVNHEENETEEKTGRNAREKGF
jgi:hypothetical protein